MAEERRMEEEIKKLKERVERLEVQEEKRKKEIETVKNLVAVWYIDQDIWKDTVKDRKKENVGEEDITSTNDVGDSSDETICSHVGACGCRRRLRSVVVRKRESEEEEEPKGKKRKESETGETQGHEEIGRGAKEELIRNKGLLVRRGRRFKGEAVGDMIWEKIGTEDWFPIETSNAETGWIIFRKKEERDLLWSLEEVVRKEGIFLLDEWLSMEERRGRNALIERKEEEIKKAREEGRWVNIRALNKELWIEGIKYVWNKERKEVMEEGM